jgi:hypothetical protein
MSDQLQLGFFYNTTHLEGNELHMRRFKADTEARLILAFFKMHPGEFFTPFDVYNALGYTDILKITSVRRSMADLTNTNPPLLEKTDIMKQGERGALNHTWKLV